MRVTLRTQGGLAAAITMRLPPKVVDSDDLPPEAEAELRTLVSAAADTAVRSASAHDAMTYTITVEEAGESSTLTAGDTTMSPAFDKLMSWIENQTH
jgi:hypothetical protein